MKTPRLNAALAALGFMILCVIGFSFYAQLTEDRYIHTIAPLWWFQKSAGGALQRAALRQPDLLPMYGSSELRAGAARTGRELLASYPTGFMVFPIGWPKVGPLSMALTLAATDAAATNRKIVISLAPSYFSIEDAFYEGDFSALNATELTFSTHLSFALKQSFAQRMLQYPQTVQHDFILRFALNQLANDSVLHRVFYGAVFPLGRLQLWIYRLQDHWEVLSIIQEKQLKTTVHREPTPLDWPETIARLNLQSELHANNNQFGFDNDYWKTHAAELLKQKDSWPDAKLAQAIQNSPGWHDLDLLLREVKELGIQTIILSVPMKGVFFDYLGNSANTRALYYQKMHEVGERYAIPVFTFETHETDKYFIFDVFDHLSRGGWATYDQVMDAFYHDTLTNALGH